MVASCSRKAKAVVRFHSSAMSDVAARNKERGRKFAEKYLENPKKCKSCQTIISYQNRRNDYCDQSCAATVNNGKRELKLFPHKCAVCDNIIQIRKERVYCSHKCRVKDQWLRFKSKVDTTGVIDIKDDSSGRRMAKRYLVEIRGHLCEICNNTEWMGKPIPIVLDHIDGNSENSLIANLRLVCGNCNMQLPTFAGRNKGNGRAWRRKRYAEGLSS